MWTKQQIRLARKIELAAILMQRNYHFHPLENGNFRILSDDTDKNAGIIVKKSFWTWQERNMAGNPIDLFVKIEGRSFDQAMEIITDAPSWVQKNTSPVASPAKTTTAAGTIYDSNAGIAKNRTLRIWD